MVCIHSYDNCRILNKVTNYTKSYSSVSIDIGMCCEGERVFKCMHIHFQPFHTVVFKSQGSERKPRGHIH